MYCDAVMKILLMILVFTMAAMGQESTALAELMAKRDAAIKTAEATPPATTIDQRKKAIQAVYVAELGKLQTRFTNEGNAAMVALVKAEIAKAPPAEAPLGNSALARETGKDKVTISAKVLQVLDEGLLFSGGNNGTYVLKNHPDEKKLVDGSSVHCYAIKSEGVFSYTDVQGAKRTARLYYYFGKKIGN